MSKYHVFYDAERAEEFEEDVKPLLEEGAHFLPYSVDVQSSVPSDTRVLLWLGDEALYSLLPYASEQQWAVGFLPHPDMSRLYRSFAIPKKIEEALADIEATAEPVMVDLMYCNEQLVLGSVMLGNPSIMRPAANLDDGIWSKLKHLTLLAFNLSKAPLCAYKIETEKGFVLNTAALGIATVYRSTGSDFTKRVVPESLEDDAYLNTIILAPRSLSGTILFLFKSLFPSKQKAKGLAGYIGHIKTKSLIISAKREIEFSIDSQYLKSEKVEIEIRPNSLQVLSQLLPKKSSEESPKEESKESVRVAFLPKGEAVKELVSRRLPWIYHVDYEEMKETFVTLKENAHTSQTYLVLMVLSTMLATVGLFANSAPVIIGAMILAPLMSPIISLSMGVLRQSLDLIITSSKTLVTGIFLALAFGTLLTVLTPLHTINSEIGARLSPNILDLAVAIISGIAGAYASARSEVAKSLAGVAIAVALVPPLAVAGIGIGWLDWAVFSGASLLFIANMLGMVLAGSVTFLVMGFSPFHLVKRGIIYTLLAVGVISIPLVLSFNSMVEEQRAVYALHGWKDDDIEIRDIKVHSEEPLYVSVKLLSHSSLDSEDIDRVKNEIENLLKREIKLEATTAVLR